MSSDRIESSSSKIHVFFLFFIYTNIMFTESGETKNLVGKLDIENPGIPPITCHCEVNNAKDILKSESLVRERHNNPLLTMRNSRPTGRLAEVDPQERKEKINESMARFMQLLTFFGHVDNFLTQKTHGLLKIMGKAVDADEDEEEEEYPARRFRSVKHNPPKIITTITS